VENYSGYGGYTLTNTFVKPTVAKDVEKNDTPATGRTLLIGGTVTGHVGYSRTAYNTLDTIDYYKVKTTADGDLKMNFTTNGTLYALARFWDSDGVTQIGYQYVGYGSSNSLVIPHLSSAATYYVSVENYSGYGTYKIASTFTKPPQTKDVEKNDTSLTALAFPLNSTMTGHLGYSRNKYSVLDTIDYYKVTVSGTGNLNISLSTSGTLYGLVRIWGTNGTTQINYVYVGFGSSNSVSTALPAGGTYYVSVEAYSGYGGYTLKNTF
jgi:hypothetical protein